MTSKNSFCFRLMIYNYGILIAPKWKIWYNLNQFRLIKRFSAIIFMDFISIIKNYFRNVWFLWALSLTLNIITFLFLYFKIKPGQSPLALHYNVLVGVLWYGPGRNLYFIPAIGMAILIVNFTLFRAIKNRQDFLAALSALVSFFVEFILLSAVLFLTRVN